MQALLNFQQLIPLFFSKLLYLFAVLDLADENFGRFKAWDVVLIDDDGRVARNVTGNLFLSLLVNEAAKSTHIYVMARSHVGFYNVEKCFYRCRNIGFIDSGLVCNLIDYVCLGHVLYYLFGVKIKIQGLQI